MEACRLVRMPHQVVGLHDLTALEQLRLLQSFQVGEARFLQMQRAEAEMAAIVARRGVAEEG